MVGLTPARKVLTRFGFAWGQADAGAMKTSLQLGKPRRTAESGTRSPLPAGSHQIRREVAPNRG